MDSNSISKKAIKRNQLARPKTPHSVKFAEASSKSANGFVQYLSAVNRDLTEGRVASGVGNAIANISGKIIKIKELEFKYGRILDPKTQQKTFLLSA